MSERVPTWVRVGLVVLLAPVQLVTGLWAVIDPAGWFEQFPGVGPALVAAEPPFNAHLATDAGAGFLATGIAVVVAALLGSRSATWTALAAYAAFGVPHVLYHWLNPAPGLSEAEGFASVGAIVVGLVVAAVLAIGAARSEGGEPAPEPSAPS